MSTLEARLAMDRYKVTKNVASTLVEIQSDLVLRTLLVDAIAELPVNDELTTFCDFVSDDLADTDMNGICVGVSAVMVNPKNRGPLELIVG